jgi:hypothetical protein
MGQLRSWILGEKHPDTPRTVYMNCYEHDRIRRILPARCTVCDYVVSRNAEAVREINIYCADKTHSCHIGGSKAHQVCDLCYEMHHALYVNYKLMNMNYFRDIDEKVKRDYDDFKRRDRKP